MRQFDAFEVYSCLTHTSRALKKGKPGLKLPDVLGRPGSVRNFVCERSVILFNRGQILIRNLIMDAGIHSAVFSGRRCHFLPLEAALRPER